MNAQRMVGATELLAGPNSVREALRARRRRIEQVLLSEGASISGPLAEIVQMCRERAIAVTRVTHRDLDRLGADLRTQGVIAMASPYPYTHVDRLLGLAQERGEPPFLLALDLLQDPQNVGALLRTAEAVGIHGVILPERGAAGVTPAVSRASAGAVEHMLIARITNLARTLNDLKQQNIWVVGVENHPTAQDYRSVDLNRPLILVLGGEGHGMRRLIVESCDLLVRLPMKGQVSSLNVSAAGSVLLYQAWNARG